MIRIVEPGRPRGAATVKPSIGTSWPQIQRGLEQWIRTQPVISLIVAASVGAVLARLVKRRH
jgi:hypothetical protein